MHENNATNAISRMTPPTTYQALSNGPVMNIMNAQSINHWTSTNCCQMNLRILAFSATKNSCSGLKYSSRASAVISVSPPVSLLSATDQCSLRPSDNPSRKRLPASSDPPKSQRCNAFAGLFGAYCPDTSHIERSNWNSRMWATKYEMYWTSAGTWNFAPASKCFSDRLAGDRIFW